MEFQSKEKLDTQREEGTDMAHWKIESDTR